MQQQQADPQTQFRSVQWIYAQLEKREDVDRVEWETQTDGMRGDRGKPGVSDQLKLEQELLDCQGLEVLLHSIAWFPDEKVTIALILGLVLKLTSLQMNTQRFLTEVSRLGVLCDLLRFHTSDHETTEQAADESAGEKKEAASELQIPLLCLELLGTLLSENGPAKLMFESCSGVTLMLSFLERESFRHEASVVAECCYILAVFSYENGK